MENQESHYIKPADRVFRPRRIKKQHPRRILGIQDVFSTGYGNVSSSVYFVLGLVALAAAGITPIVLAIAGVLYVLIALTYAEGTSMYPEAGGASTFALHAFNEITGFFTGWFLMLSYISIIAITTFTIPAYLGYFCPLLKESVTASILLSIGVIVILMCWNIFGLRSMHRLKVILVIIDILLIVSLIIAGVVLFSRPGILEERISGSLPSVNNFILGVALASIAYTSIETMSQLSNETLKPEKRFPVAVTIMMVTVVLVFTGMSLVAIMIMTPQELSAGWLSDPVAGIAAGMKSVVPVFEPLVAVLAVLMLVLAANTAMLSICRLIYSMSSNNCLPSSFIRVHHKFHTPWVTLLLVGVLSAMLLSTGYFITRQFVELGSLYVFGALLAFMAAHASIIWLRVKRPDSYRPFKLRCNIRIKKKYDIPVLPVIGLACFLVIWAVVLYAQPVSTWIGIIWLLIGIALYVTYRKSKVSKRRQVKRQ